MLACQASRAVSSFDRRGREGETEHMQPILTLFWNEQTSPSLGHDVVLEKEEESGG